MERIIFTDLRDNIFRSLRTETIVLVFFTLGTPIFVAPGRPLA